jgi:hypothetical protein
VLDLEGLLELEGGGQAQAVEERVDELVQVGVVLQLLHHVLVDLLVQVAQVQQTLQVLPQRLLPLGLAELGLQLADALLGRGQFLLPARQFLLLLRVVGVGGGESGKGLFCFLEFLQQTCLFGVGCLLFLLEGVLDVLQRVVLHLDRQQLLCPRPLLLQVVLRLLEFFPQGGNVFIDFFLVSRWGRKCVILVLWQSFILLLSILRLLFELGEFALEVGLLPAQCLHLFRQLPIMLLQLQIGPVCLHEVLP